MDLHMHLIIVLIRYLVYFKIWGKTYESNLKNA